MFATDAERMLMRKADCRINAQKSRDRKLKAHAAKVIELQDAKDRTAATKETKSELNALVLEKQRVIEKLLSQVASNNLHLP